MVTHLMNQTAGALGEMVFELLARTDDDFCGSRGRRSAEIGNKIRHGEIAFVADAGDDGNFGSDNRANENFFVEGPQIFERASSARNNDHFHRFHTIEITQGRHNFTRREISLDLHGIQHYVRVGKSPLQDTQNIENGGSGGRGDHADTTRQQGQRLFSTFVEQALVSETLFQLFEGDLQSAGADRLDVADVNLIFAARFIDAERASHGYAKSVLRAKLQAPRLIAKADAPDLRLRVFQREIQMS